MKWKCSIYSFSEADRYLCVCVVGGGGGGGRGNPDTGFLATRLIQLTDYRSKMPVNKIQIQ